jgi:hypothetical protein
MQWSLALSLLVACHASPIKQKAVAVKGAVTTDINNKEASERRLSETEATDSTETEVDFGNDPKVQEAMKNTIAEIAKTTPDKVVIKQRAYVVNGRVVRVHRCRGCRRFKVITEYDVETDAAKDTFDKLHSKGASDVDALLKTKMKEAGASYDATVIEHYVLDPSADKQFIPNAVMPSCHDFQASDMTSSDPEIARCAEHILWAKEYGVDFHPGWYATKYASKYAAKNATNTSWIQSQCLLYTKSENGKQGDGHHCMIPTCSAVPEMTAVCPGKQAAAQPEGGAPWVMWLLIGGGLILLGIIGLVAYHILNPKAPKKKRAIRKVEQPKEVPAATTSVMMPVYSYPPATTSVTTAPPVYLEQVAMPMSSVSYAAPASVSYAPVTYAAPASVSYAAPFDMIDANHDGSITREEFNAFMARGS